MSSPLLRAIPCQLSIQSAEDGEYKPTLFQMIVMSLINVNRILTNDCIPENKTGSTALRLFGLQNLVVGKNAAAFDLAALGEGELYAMAGIAKRGDA